MRSRGSFLRVLGASSAFFAGAARAEAQPAGAGPTAVPVSASPGPSASAPSTAPSATNGHGPSAASLAIAATMRRFDPALTDDEIATIASGIDDDAQAGARLNAKSHRLDNGEGPITTFAVREW